MKTYLLGAELYRREEALAFARVLGWASARVTEAARALFGNSLERIDHDARTELQTAKANELGIMAWTQVQSLMGHLLAEHPLRNVGFAEALMRGELQVSLALPARPEVKATRAERRRLPSEGERRVYARERLVALRRSLAPLDEQRNPVIPAAGCGNDEPS